MPYKNCLGYYGTYMMQQTFSLSATKRILNGFGVESAVCNLQRTDRWTTL